MKQQAVALLLICLVVAPGSVQAAPPCWRPPVNGRVADPFREPPCPWCAGNRGIEFALDRPHTVAAVDAGVVTFSGAVAGTRYVTVQHRNGWLLTYGRLAGASVRRGDRVIAGAAVGRAVDSFFLSLRIDDRYRDPAPYLGQPKGRPRLVPVDGSPAPPAPPPTWRC